jgi:hypothetical protein
VDGNRRPGVRVGGPGGGHGGDGFGAAAAIEQLDERAAADAAAGQEAVEGRPAGGDDAAVGRFAAAFAGGDPAPQPGQQFGSFTEGWHKIITHFRTSVH